MSTITVMVKTPEQYGIGAICCGPKLISDNLLFIPPNVFGSIQALFSETNNNRIKDHFKTGGEFKDINENDIYYQNRQYVFFENDTIKTFTGNQVKDSYTNYNDNVIVCANRIGKKQYGDNLYNSLLKHYSNNITECIINSFKENKYIGFDSSCYSKGISSTTLHISVYNRSGDIIYNKEVYSPDSEPIDQL